MTGRGRGSSGKYIFWGAAPAPRRGVSSSYTYSSSYTGSTDTYSPTTTTTATGCGICGSIGV